MAQQFQVLRCCSCNIFQVQQVKKNKKWNCKICNEKQSVLKVYGQGSASDCRHHVQKLNLLQGEKEQAPAKMPSCVEEPLQIRDENSDNLEENLGWQEGKFKTGSRWIKYLDERCKDDGKKDGEEELLPTEKLISVTRGKTVENPRKYKNTSLCTTDDQGPIEREVSGFADSVRNLKNTQDSLTMSYTKRGGDTSCQSVLSPAMEEHVLHRKNEGSASKGAGHSKWEKFLFSASCQSRASRDMLQERQETLIHRSGPAARDERATTSISLNLCNWPHAQNTPILGERGQQAITTSHVAVADIPMERGKQTPGLASSHLQERLLNSLPKQINPVSSKSFLATSDSYAPYTNLFSTNDDFDDDI